MDVVAYWPITCITQDRHISVHCNAICQISHVHSGMILGLCPANERQCLSLAGCKPRISPVSWLHCGADKNNQATKNHFQRSSSGSIVHINPAGGLSRQREREREYVSGLYRTRTEQVSKYWLCMKKTCWILRDNETTQDKIIRYS